jgi:hypothetical protein
MGWDYSHAGDAINLHMQVEDLPQEIVHIIERINSLNSHSMPAKKWTLAEVEQDILDAAISLSETIKAIQDSVASIARTV